MFENIKGILYCILLAVIFTVFQYVLCHTSTTHTTPGIEWLKELLKAQAYSEAQNVGKPPLGILPPKTEDMASSVSYAAGEWVPEQNYTPADTIPVELQEVTLVDNSHWVKLTIDGKPVDLPILQYYQRDRVRRWGIHYGRTTRAETGLGINYRLCEPLGVGVEPAVMVGTDFKWVMPELRLSKDVLGDGNIGGGIGYHIPSNSWQGEVSIGLRF